MSVVLPSETSGWQARLALEFEQRQQRTVMVKNQFQGPLRVQKPFYPEQDVCHAYVLHPPGGVVGGDELNIEIKLTDKAHALITTPASAKFYHSNQRIALQLQQLDVGDGAVLEWLPQDTILFSGCRAKSQTRINLQTDARFIGWEIVCLGRPASGEHYVQGFFRQSFELTRDGKPLLIERARLEGDSPVLHAGWGMANYTVMGLMVVSNANKQMLELVRQQNPELDQACACLHSVTLIGELLVCRVLGHQGIEVRDHFIRIWESIRQAALGKPATAPRIWNT